MTLSYAGQGAVEMVDIWRNGASLIAERRFMFELLAFVKQAGVSNDPDVVDCIDLCTEHYGSMMEEDVSRQKALLENLEYLRGIWTTGIENVYAKIENLFQQHSTQVGVHIEVTSTLSMLISRASVL